MKQVKSYIQDATDFISKLQQLNPLPHTVLLATMDVRSLYTNISNKDGLRALKEALDSRHSNEPQSELITSLMNHILTLNNVAFNGTNYLQVKGRAMDTIAAPSYATIVMGNFEEKFIYPHISADCLMYCRLNDDIFFICTLPETRFITFIADLNTRHESIKFDFEISKAQMSFLDTVVYIDKNRRIQTTLYRKPTDTSSYLHFRSSHPKHLKENLPYSQDLRLKRICSEETEYHKDCTKMTDNFIKRGYNKSLVTQQIEKANAKSRHDTLTYKTHKTNKHIPLTTTINPTHPEIST